MCQVGVLAALEEGSSCQGRHRDTQGCRAVWSHRGLCKPLEESSSLAPSIHVRLHRGLPISTLYLTLRRLHCAGPMRHIQMDPAPKEEEVGGENSHSTSADLTSPGQAAVLNAVQDCRVLVEYPENEHKLQKVYHVSITSDGPGPKAICRQALKRGPPEQLPEPSRSPRRAFWGHNKNEGPSGNYQSDADYLSCSLADEDDEEDLDTFEDGLLTEEIPMCSSAQHFSHSGLKVIEHRVETFPSKEPQGRRLTTQPLPKNACRKTDSPSPPPCTTLHNRSPKEAQLGNSDELSTFSETNGSNVYVEPRTYKESTSNQHILDNVLHNIAHPETLTENLEAGSSHSSANGDSVGVLSSEDPSKETSLPCMQDQKPQTADGEDPSSLARTPPGLARLCSPGSGNTAVKRKLLPSTEIDESCSEDEGLGKRWRGSESCQTLHGSCRSTDSKAAPFWNHLLPTARNSQKSPTDCTSRRTKRGLRLKSRTLRSLRKGQAGRSCTGNWAKSCISRSLLGNFEESILRGRFAPCGQIEGFTAEIGASGSYCPQHVTLPVEVTYFHISEHSAPSPFLGVIDLEAVGRKGYSVPSTGTIQVTLFNPNKTVVKMFLVTYDFKDMPVNHMTFLRHRIFLVPVQENDGENEGQHSASGGAAAKEKAKRILCYLMHLRFQRSKSGKIYLNEDIRLLFSRKSIEMDTGIPYELKSFTEAPKNPKYSPRL
ncbi:protein FAM214B [Bufo bufo]|uniref:protein FAM214B n=1 Tax=Bufo bufo TaxID=8384 RepID=UPI001ABE1FBF|nr:protein FAM214B [Bufo bufo]XP_040277133.1 protein FAM214B [Bufo bufo]